MLVRVILALFAFNIGLSIPSLAQAERVNVFAAASLGDVLKAAADIWNAQTGHDAIISVGSSATLARQIELGAPADLYISANIKWMDWLVEVGGVDVKTRTNIAGNQLALITAIDLGRQNPNEGEFPEVKSLLGSDGRLAVGLVSAVPAGIYAKAAFEYLGQWQDLKGKLVETDNVRAALALVALGEAPAGIVYTTDAMAEPRVFLRAVFPENSHSPILYPAAVINDAKDPELAQSFLDWIKGPEGQAVLLSKGFFVPDE